MVTSPNYFSATPPVVAETKTAMNSAK